MAATLYTVTTVFGTPIHLLPEELKAYAARVREAITVLDGLCALETVGTEELCDADEVYRSVVPAGATETTEEWGRDFDAVPFKKVYRAA